MSNKKEELVSVVLPIYNTSKYLDKCINSIVNQTYKNLEIILVDDGSIDESPLMCDEWVKRDSRIRVIHKRNEGLGNARNTGINYACGKYILFIDSDDYVSFDLINSCYNAAKENNSDVVIYGFSTVNETGEILNTSIPSMQKSVYLNDEIKNEYLPSLISNKTKDLKIANLNMSAWSCMYSLKLIKDNNWSFVSERKIISEDVYSLLSLYSYVNSVSILNQPLYFYRQNGASLSHTYRDDRFFRINEFYLECLKLADGLEYSEKIKNCISHPYLANIIGSMKISIRSNLTKKQKKKYISQVLKNETFKNAISIYNPTGDSMIKKILLFFMKYNFVNLSYFLVSLKVKVEGKRL